MGLTNQTLIICSKVRRLHSYGIFNGNSPMESAFPLFLLEFSFIVFISRLLRFLLRPLGQPRIVSQIIGGIILGPSVLGGNKKFKKHVFPENEDFVIRNLGTIGFMYFLFICGVRMDVFTIRKVDRKHWYVALVGLIMPLVGSVSVALIVRKSLGEATAKPGSILGITSLLAISAFPSVYQIVREFDLIGSEMGRMALSTSVIGDVIGMIGLSIYEAMKHGESKPLGALWYLLSLALVMASIIGGIRQVMLWIVRTTPEGNQVDQIYVVMILLGVMFMGFITDMFGLAIANGSLWLGLAVPDGPPLGAFLVEKSETIVMEILLPLSFLYVGSITDLSSMTGHWSYLQPLLVVVLAGYTIKLVSTILISRYLDMTPRDSVTLSLLLSLRGEVELLLFLHWLDWKMINQPQFTLLVLMSLFVTALATPVISILYDPSRPYMVNTRRNIQHTPPSNELHIVACIHGEENLFGLLKLLDLSNPTVRSPFTVHALHHIELVGRANPVFIDHENEEMQSDVQSAIGSLNKALKIFQEARGDHIKIHAYTSITPTRTMYRDICELALSKEACMILLPLHKEASDNVEGVGHIKKQAHQSVSASVLAQAPCSVGILVDRSPSRNIFGGIRSNVRHHFVVLFLGGPDAREALSYADRAAGSDTISLTVIRFLSHDSEGDDEIEKKLDDGLVTWFWVKNEGNERSIYREVVVRNGQETINAIQAINDEDYDLWIVGRKHGINPVLLRGLPNWRENRELGVIGDYVSSADFDSKASVLVLQQQVLRRQENYSWFSMCTKCW